MCGLSGLFTKDAASADTLRSGVLRMADALAHRGPDDSGTWVDASAGVAFGFRRLAIIDLTPAGHQPMMSASGRFTVVFNGEVFNHRSLRAELETLGCRFRGHSDTEMILAAFERWGVDAAVRRFVGMFAIAAWDGQTQRLFLIRDRLGIKPLYVFSDGKIVLFGSELKALAAHPQFERRLDPVALSAYFRYLYVPAPRTIYQQTWKLQPGHILTLSDSRGSLPEPVPYWTVDQAARQGVLAREPVSDRDAVDALDSLLQEAVRLRLESDVPLGALLSGGVDSSTVVALMQAASSRPVRTFTIGFDSAVHDEAAHAARVAAHLGTDHVDLHLTGTQALDVVPLLPRMFDEPLADPSQIPTYLVSALARRHVTVALTGDGGDELFGGYNRYPFGGGLVRRAKATPPWLRRAAAGALRSLSPQAWDRAFATLGFALPARMRQRLPGEKLYKVAAVLAAPTEAGQYRALMSAWQNPEDLFCSDLGSMPDRLDELGADRDGLSLEEAMMRADQGHYLADDLLAKVDRASMAVSLEARVPLLDHRVVEHSWRLPLHFKIREGRGKWILRQVLYRYVPATIVDRPKMGFSVPVAQWLKGPLKTWAEQYLHASVIGRDGLLDPAPVQRAWVRLLRGQETEALPLWAVLMFLAWRECWEPAV